MLFKIIDNAIDKWYFGPGNEKSDLMLASISYEIFKVIGRDFGNIDRLVETSNMLIHGK